MTNIVRFSMFLFVVAVLTASMSVSFATERGGRVPNLTAVPACVSTPQEAIVYPVGLVNYASSTRELAARMAEAPVSAFLPISPADFGAHAVVRGVDVVLAGQGLLGNEQRGLALAGVLVNGRLLAPKGVVENNPVEFLTGTKVVFTLPADTIGDVKVKLLYSTPAGAVCTGGTITLPVQ